MIILKVLSLFSLLLFGITQELHTPISIVNPYNIIESHLLKAPYKSIEDSDSSISVKALLQFNLNEFSQSKNDSFHLCAQSIEILLKDIVHKKSYALKSKFIIYLFTVQKCWGNTLTLLKVKKKKQ